MMRIIAAAMLSIILCLQTGCVGGSAYATNAGAGGNIRIGKSF